MPDAVRSSTQCTKAVDFHVEIRGNAPRAVFLHGLAGDVHTWDPLWDVLSVEALRYDLRGFGRSVVREAEAYDHAEDLLTILDRFAIDCCDLVGGSMGGSVALNFALTHSNRVRSLVLISPGLMGWERSVAWREHWERILWHAQSGDMHEAKRLWWEHPMFETTRASTARQSLFDSIQRYSGAHWVADDHKPVLADVERLHSLTTPTLLLTGGRDEEESKLIAEVIATSAPHVRRVEVPEGGHMLHLEDPHACAQHMQAFWATLAPFEQDSQ